MIRRASLLVALFSASDATALDLPANARLTAERVSERDRYEAPVAPFDGNTIPAQPVEGRIARRVWQITAVNLTPLQVLAPLRAQLEQDGYEIALDCKADACGGFDFRFGTEVLPAPAMFVNLRNYHFLTMRDGPADQPDSVVTVLVSTTTDAAYVQVIEATRRGAPEAAPVVEERPAAPPEGPGDDLAAGLLANGYHVLDGLEFDTGATELGPGPFVVLAQVAGFLADNPEVRLALVGHTDTVGGLDGNIAISRARARSVRQRLIDAYGIDGGRLDAEGMGYLAPRTSNFTANGREDNRRVEAVVLPAE